MSTAATTQKQQQERLKNNEAKWTKTLMDAGWTVLPSVILERQKAFGLDAIDVNILLHLAKHWWYSDNLPHPSKASIAECMDIDPSTVRRRIARMENDGLIKRIERYDPGTRRQENNFYSFEGLIKAATPFALEAIEVKEVRRAEAAARRLRKKPQAPSLAVVGGTDVDAG